MTTPYVILTRDGATKIANSNADGGTLGMRHSPSEDFYIIDKVETAENLHIDVKPATEYEALRYGDPLYRGRWLRKPAPDLNLIHCDMLRRVGVGLALDVFRQHVPSVKNPGNNIDLLITHDPDIPDHWKALGAADYAGWIISRDGVMPTHVEVEPATFGLSQLGDHWPLAELSTKTAVVVGLGSIGGAAAQALAAYGIGHLDLVDPDRLLWHNLVRHVLGKESVGRYKVDGMAANLRKNWPTQSFRPHRLNVINDAHLIRPMLPAADIIVCAADGIAARRAVSHLARRAEKPAILACVLAQGAIGEALRLRPTPRFGCLLCQRAHLAQQGALDAEADQELDYGAGLIHQPMTAVAPDLHLIGQLAAKMAVATLLETHHGDHTQIAPGDHAVIGLRPSGYLHAPFDVARVGEVNWHAIPEPRPNCPTCTP